MKKIILILFLTCVQVLAEAQTDPVEYHLRIAVSDDCGLCSSLETGFGSQFWSIENIDGWNLGNDERGMYRKAQLDHIFNFHMSFKPEFIKNNPFKSAADPGDVVEDYWFNSDFLELKTHIRKNLISQTRGNGSGQLNFRLKAPILGTLSESKNGIFLSVEKIGSIDQMTKLYNQISDAMLVSPDIKQVSIKSTLINFTLTCSPTVCGLILDVSKAAKKNSTLSLAELQKFINTGKID